MAPAVIPRLDALIVKPDQMSVWALHKYIQHLAGNRQRTDFRIACGRRSCIRSPRSQ